MFNLINLNGMMTQEIIELMNIIEIKDRKI